MLGLLIAALLSQTPTEPNIGVMSIQQQQGGWQITVKTSEKIDRSRLKIELVGNVSNSSLAGHMFPKQSILTEVGEFVLIPSESEEVKCVEKLAYRIVQDNTLILYLHHAHHNNEFSPLLGKRKLTLTCGKYSANCFLDMRREEYAAKTIEKMSIPEDRISRLEEDGSIYLTPSVPGSGYFKFSETRVKPGTKVRVKFSYKLLQGSDGDLYYQLSQFEEKFRSFQSPEQPHRIALKADGKWIKFEEVFKLDRATNNVVITFKFTDSEFGEAWIKDFSFEPWDGYRKTSP